MYTMRFWTVCVCAGAAGLLVVHGGVGAGTKFINYNDLNNCLKLCQRRSCLLQKAISWPTLRSQHMRQNIPSSYSISDIYIGLVVAITTAAAAPKCCIIVLYTSAYGRKTGKGLAFWVCCVERGLLAEGGGLRNYRKAFVERAVWLGNWENFKFPSEA